MYSKKKALIVFVFVTICALIMSIIDSVVQPGYIIKSLLKVILFLAVPTIFFITDKDGIKQLTNLFLPKKRVVIPALIIGISVYLIIVGGYFLLRNYFDFSSVTERLTSSAGVSADNFVYVSLYISFVNSLLEEFFFRGFAFLTLRRLISRKTAYIFSSSVFALYHIGMTVGWFSFGVFVLSLIGLFAGGCIFNYFNEKSENIYVSWIIHMFANFGINTVGFILFGII